MVVSRRITPVFALVIILVLGIAIAAYLLNVPTLPIVLCTVIALGGGWYWSGRINRESPPSE